MLEEFSVDQSIACKIITKILEKNNISHAYLIETNNYYRGFDFALAFAKALLCPSKYISNKLCGSCTQCHRIDSNNFSELEVIEPDGSWIKKEQLDKLQHNFSNKSLESSRKVYIVNHADKMNQSAANSILKFLEEPEENITAILVADSAYSLIDTIVSRCQCLKLLDVKDNFFTDSTAKKLSAYIFNNEKDIDEFATNIIDNDFLNSSINFVKEFEKKGTDTILNENRLCCLFLNDKILFEHFLDTLVLFYKDCLNKQIKKNINIFNDYEDDIDLVSERNNYNQIIEKIEVLTNIKERLKYNCNLNLLLDKLIILLGGV